MHSKMAKRVLEMKSNELGIAADEQELAQELGIESGVFSERLRSYGQTMSLDAALNDHSENTLIDLLSDTALQNTEDEIHRKELVIIVMSAMKELPARESEILTRRYGLNGTPQGTLEEVGKVMGISRNRVQFLQVRALKKLKVEIERRCETNLRE